MDLFAFSAHQDSKMMNRIGTCSTLKSSRSTTLSFEILTEEFKAVVSEKDKMEHRD